MNWFKIANNNNIVNKTKSILKNNVFIKNLMKYYNIPEINIDNELDIVITELDGQFAKGNKDKIFLDPKLFEGNFFEDNFHFVVHEFFHWLKRKYENRFYFNDPEEIQSFVVAIAWQLMNGKNEKEIERIMCPIIEGHYKNNEEAKKVFLKMFEEALKLVKSQKSDIRI